jgi:hypothetical protein
MKIITALLLQIIIMNAAAQLQPVGSGVFHFNELTVKKDKDREGRKICQGTTNEFAWFEMRGDTHQGI